MNLDHEKEKKLLSSSEQQSNRTLVTLIALEKYCKFSLVLEREWETSKTEVEKEVSLFLLDMAVTRMNEMLKAILPPGRKLHPSLGRA